MAHPPGGRAFDCLFRDQCPVSLANRPLNCNVHMDVSQQGPTAGSVCQCSGQFADLGPSKGVRFVSSVWVEYVHIRSQLIPSFITNLLTVHLPSHSQISRKPAGGLLFRVHPRCLSSSWLVVSRLS